MTHSALDNFYYLSKVYTIDFFLLFITNKILRAVLLFLWVYWFSVWDHSRYRKFLFLSWSWNLWCLSFFFLQQLTRGHSLYNCIARFQYVAPVFTQNMTMSQFTYSVLHFIWKTGVVLATYMIFGWIIWSLSWEERKEYKKGGMKEGKNF